MPRSASSGSSAAPPDQAAESPQAASPRPTLAQLRKKIDQFDREIVRLLNQRAVAARQIGQLKSAAGTHCYNPAREEEILRKVTAESDGPLSAACLTSVFRELISGCRALEQPVRVAYLGPEYSFSHQAALFRFGHSADLVPVATIGAVFDAVEHQQADFGLVPLENSTDGRIADTLRRFPRSTVRICGELPLRVHQYLLGLGPLGEVRRVYSKPEALAQCQDWLAQHLPSAERVPVASTSEAARRAREEPATAAVASRQAGVGYGLVELAKHIEDRPDNVTRFAVIGAQPAEKSGDDKTAMLFEIEHRPGALADVMAVFKRKGLNLTWLESLPGAGGRFLMFVEMEGHQSEVRLRRAVATLDKKVSRLALLGSYARAQPVG